MSLICVLLLRPNRGLADAWGRTVSVVTQPGVDVGLTFIYSFVPEKACPLQDAFSAKDSLIFEAHSTDYQATQALADLVKSHFLCLKNSSELAFRFR